MPISKHAKVIIQAIGLALIILVALYINSLNIQDISIPEHAKRFGYVGLLVVSMISGFNIIIPIPVIAFLPALVSIGFHHWVTVGIISLGMTLGDCIGFFIGKLSRDAIDVSKKNKWYSYITVIKKKYPRVPLIILFFYAAVAPAPNELLVIPMAFLGYRFPHMVLLLLAGNLAFNILVSFGVTIIS